MSESELANSIKITETQYDIGNYYDWYNKVVMFPGVFFRGNGDFIQMTAAEMANNVYNAYDRSFIKEMQTAVDKRKPQARARTDQRPRNSPLCSRCRRACLHAH